MKKIILPYNFKPRDYQLPLFKKFDSGCKRIVCVWHRRAGKDKSLLNIVAKEMMHKVGTYYYFFPTYNQGKKILWNGLDKDGFKFLNHIPQELRKRVSSQEMLIELINGSIFQIIGTDNVDSVVGTNPIGCVFSEYALQNPVAWGYIRPILAENKGWAIFNFTSRGKNHGYDLVKYAKKKDDWWVNILSADKTDVFTKEELIDEQEQYKMEDGDDLRFQQEYMCSFEGAMQGSYYGKIISRIDKKNQIKDFVVEELPVNTYWDLGIGDSTAIWFVQLINNEIRIIDYLEASGEGLKYYIKELQKKDYIYGEHWAPHDIKVREFSSGKSRIETARKLGIQFRVAPRLSLEDGIQAVRNVLHKCYFHKTNCEKGLNALRQYHKEFDEKNKVYKDRPTHDWSSHGSDAFRYMAVTPLVKKSSNTFLNKPIQYE